MVARIRTSTAVALVLAAFGTGNTAAQPPRPSRAVEIDAPRGELQAVFKKHFHRELNLDNYQEISLAITRWLGQEGRGAYAGRWNAEVRTDSADNAAYGVLMIDADSALDIKLDALRAAFKKQYNRRLDVQKPREVQQAINRWLATNGRRGYFGFWSGEEGEDKAGNPVYGVVLLRPFSRVSPRLEDLRTLFKKNFDRALDVNSPLEVGLAVNRWLMANKLGAFFGLWNGEESKDGAGKVVYCVVLIQPVEPAELAYVPNSTRRVCQLTGDFDRASGRPTLNQTGKRFGVEGTDLGSSFEHKGKLYFLFGDTWGRGGDRDVLAWTASTNPHKIDLEFPQAADGKWRPLSVPGISQGAFEVPSGGISLRDAMYVVFTTDHSDKKMMGRSVLARSRDDGRTFETLYDLSRSKFINIAFVSADGWLYLYGSGDFRKSNVYLARVRPADIEDRSRLEYFRGTGPDESPRWSRREAEAVPLFKHPQVGELCGSYLKPVNRYVLLYNALKPRRGITMRSARTPWGPWSDGEVIFDPDRHNGYGHFMHISTKDKSRRDALSDPGREVDWGGEYGPYVMARYTTGSRWSCRIYYTMSTWNPYQVVVMQTDLELKGESK